MTRSTIWLMLGKSAAFAFNFALPLVLVRRLDQSQFGMYKQVFLVVATAMTLLPLGFGQSACYFLPRADERPQQIVLNILLFHLFVAGAAALLLTIQPDLLATVFNNGDLTGYGPLVGLALLLWVVGSVLETIAAANQEFRVASGFIVATQFTKSVLLLTAAISFGSMRSLIWAAILQGVAQMVLLLLYLRSRFREFWREFEWPVLRRQLSYAMPFGMAAALAWVQFDLHNFIVSNQLGAAAFAIYSIGCLQLPLVVVLNESIGYVMVPHVSYLQASGRSREIVGLTARMMRKQAAVYFPLFVILMVVGRELITVLFTTQYIESWPVFAINLSLIPLYIVSSACDPVIRAHAEHRYFLVKARAALSVLLVAGLWVGTKRFGLVGAVTVVVGVGLVERLVTAFKVARILGVTRRDIGLIKDIGKLGIAAVVAGLAAMFVRSLVLTAHSLEVLVLSTSAFSLVYIVAVLVLGVLLPNERDWLRQLVVRLRRFGAWKVEADPL